MITVICHIRNEANFYLPFWLKHHYNIFDNGIIIDYNSTDNSLDIVKELAPNWQVITSKNKLFSSREIDQEVMDIESKIDGWKIALNVTEFLMKKNLREYIDSLEQKKIKAVRAKAYTIIDNPSLLNINPNHNLQLYDQYYYGYDESKYDLRSYKNIFPPAGQRNRLLHMYNHGHYRIGRHSTNIRSKIDQDLVLLWYGFCPLHWKIQRNKNIQPMLNAKDLKKNWGIHHTIDTNAIIDLWLNKQFPIGENLYNIINHD